MDMDRRTKKMAKTQGEIDSTLAQTSEVARLFDATGSFKTNTTDGADARKQALDKLGDKRENLSATLQCLRTRLEVETVAMHAGTDTDFEEPSPREKLEQAS